MPGRVSSTPDHSVSTAAQIDHALAPCRRASAASRKTQVGILRRTNHAGMNRTRRRNGVPLADHIAEVAAVLFYQRGINVVGVDTIADEAGVTKRTLYRHYSSKDQLIAAALLHGPRIHFPGEGSPRERILGVFDDLIRFVGDPSYRGCPYINAAAELTSGTHPGRVIVEEHTARRRAWFRRRLEGMGIEDAVMLAEQLDVLFDGALANATKRGVPVPAQAARAAVEALIDARPYAQARLAPRVRNRVLIQEALDARPEILSASALGDRPPL